MRLYQVTVTAQGSREYFRANRGQYLGVTRIAKSSKIEAIRAYNDMREKLAGLPARFRLEVVQVPDRLTLDQWAKFIETEVIDLEVVEVLRDEIIEAAA